MKSLLMLAALMVAASAHAKLPAPAPMDDAAKAKAAEAAAKTAHGNKVAAYQLCLSMDKAAQNHFKTVAAMGKAAPSPAATAPTCTDPGPFVYTPAPQ
ncbi:MAG: hypothetical protein ACK40L_13000 [Hydrogenophaga sp.]|jgi:hypothetical protein|nr:hypothetical protein [Hydrogenophaga sp.]